MKNILILLLLPILAFCQWDRAIYQNLTNQNFREYSLFLESVNIENIDYGRLNAVIFYLTNEQRIKQKSTKLAYHPALEISAWHHSKSMAEKGFFSHTNNKQRSRKQTEDRARLAGISNPYLAENIAYQMGKSFKNYLELGEIFIDQWMNSPGHRSNILSEKALQMGCGVYFLKDNWYATQNFQWFEHIQEGKREDDLP